MNKREDREREKKRKKKIEDTIESRSLKKKKFRRSRGIFDSSRRRGWTDASFFGYSMFAMSNVLGFAQQERLSSHCRLHVFKTKKKKKSETSRSRMALVEEIRSKDGMENWTIRSSRRIYGVLDDNNRTTEFSARYLTNSSSSGFVSFRFRTTVYARYR